MGKECLLTIGSGINVDSSEPTSYLNDIAVRCGKDPVGREILLAEIMTQIEHEIMEFQESTNVETFLKSYCGLWLHTNQEVNAKFGDDVKKCTVTGIDEFGYLKVTVAGSGEEAVVHPDGNSFDMMRGLIAPKANQ